MQWPARWLLPAEVALNVYDTLRAVNQAMANLDGERLSKWNAENGRLLKTALAIQKLRDGLENDGDQDLPTSDRRGV